MSRVESEHGLRRFLGPIGEQIHAYDWSMSSLGPMEGWPESLCYFIQLILSSKIAMMIFWGDDQIIFANESTQNHLFQVRNRVFPLGHSAPVYFKDTWDFWGGRVEKVLRTGESFLEDDSPSFHNGAIEHYVRYRSLQVSPIKDPKGDISGVIFMAFDSTQKILALKKLEDNQKRLRDAIESSEIGTFEYRIEVDEMIVSDRFIELVGGERGMSRSEFLFCMLPEFWEVRNRAYEHALKTGNLKYQARYYKYPNRWAEVEGKIFYDEKGNPFKMAGTIMDITQEKEIQRSLMESNSHLERELIEKNAIEKQKDEFLQIASHELRTPLTSIRGYAHLLEEILKEKNMETENKMISKLNLKIDHLHSLVQNLFDVSQLNTGKLDFVNDIFDLSELVRFIVDDFSYIRSNHHFKEEYLCDHKVMADRERISQVITNLISNAVKYSPSGSEILIRTRKIDQFIAVDIGDQGIGIKPGEFTRIFEPFYRSPNSLLPQFSGLGLGLYISSQIIFRQGGKIDVSSTLGKGSTFTFTLPIYQPEDQSSKDHSL